MIIIKHVAKEAQSTDIFNVLNIKWFAENVDLRLIILAGENMIQVQTSISTIFTAYKIE